MAAQDSKLIMNITAALNSSQLAKDMQNVREAIERGAKGIDSVLGASKSKGMKSFSDLIKSAETFAVTLDSLSKRTNPFKNVIDSLTGVSNKIQQVTGQLSQLSNMKIAPTVTLGTGTSSAPQATREMTQMLRGFIQNRIREWKPSDNASYATVKGILADFTGPAGRSRMNASTFLSQLKGLGLDLRGIASSPELAGVADKKALEQLIASIASKQSNIAGKLRSTADAKQMAATKAEETANKIQRKIETEVQKTIGGTTRYAPLTTQQIIEARTGVGRQGKSAFESAQTYMRQKYEDLDAERKMAVDELKKQRAYERSREGQDARILGGGAKSYEELRRYAKIKTPDADMAGFQKEVTSKLQGFGYSAEQVKNLSKELTNLHLKTNGMTQSSGFLAKAWEQQTQALGRLFRYYTSFFILSGIQTDLVNAASAAIKFKDSMLEVKKFLPEGSPIGSLQSSVIPMANEYAVSMDTVLGSYAEFAKQGKQANEIVDLTRSALLGVNVASADYGTVVTYLTTATNVWGYSTKETVGLIDKLAYVQAKSSAESTHLIASMQRTASMAKQFGLSLDEVLGYTAAISEKTMLPGEVIGTSMKTIIERSQRLKTLQELSKMQPFQNIQFINPFTGDMMKANDVLGLVAKSWSTLTDEQQKSVGELLAGGRQVNTFIALMENYDRALNLTKESMTSWGYATKANETEMEKFSKSWAKFRGMMIEQFGAGMFGPIITGTQKVINVLNEGAGAAYFMGTATTALIATLVGGVGVAMAFTKVAAALQTYHVAAATATAGTNSLSIAFKALGISVGGGWAGALVGIATAATAIYLGWTSGTQRQIEEQNSLNLSLEETIKKLKELNENNKMSGVDKESAFIDLASKLTPEQISAIEKVVPNAFILSKRGQTMFNPNIGVQQQIEQMGEGLGGTSKKSVQNIQNFIESLNFEELNNLEGPLSKNKKDFIEFIKIFYSNWGDMRNLALGLTKRGEEDLRDYPALRTRAAEFRSSSERGERPSLSMSDIINMAAAEKEIQIGEAWSEDTKNIMRIDLAKMQNVAKLFSKFKNILNDKIASQLTQVSESEFSRWIDFVSKNDIIKAEGKSSGGANFFQQAISSSKYETDALNAYMQEISSKTQQSLRGTRTPKYKMDVDFTSIEIATKEYQDLQSKIDETSSSIANLQKLQAINMSGVIFDSKAAEKYKEEIEKLTQTKKEYISQLQTAEQGLVAFNSLLVMNSAASSEADKQMASMTYSIITGQNALASIIKSISDVTGQFIDLNSWIQNVISSLLSIPKSISIQINAVLNALGGASVGGFASKMAGSLFGGLFKGLIPKADTVEESESRAFRTKSTEIEKETNDLAKLGEQIKNNNKEYLKAHQYREGIAKVERELGTLRQKRSAQGLTPEEEKKYNQLEANLERAKKASQKDPGAGAAKKESEDIAHQKALERIHELEKKISIEKKIQSYWEGQLTDSFKRRWEREIGDLKDKSALYAQLSKEQGLKPEEARQYERQAREADAEAKMMEAKRADVEKIHQREIAQKKFNRAIEETNKLFEYQQQIQSLDFEMGYTTEAEQQRFQMMQQEEKVQWALNQYQMIYSNEKERALEALRESAKKNGEITAEVEARIQKELEEEMIMNETVQRAKERVVEEQRATVMLEKRLRNEIFARAKQSVSEIQSTLAGAISSMFDNSAAEEKLKRIKEIMDEIAKLQQDSEFAGYNVAGAEATGSIDSINQAREKWYEVNQQMVEARKKLDEVGESTNKWKETLKSIGDTVLKKISERFAEMIMDKSGLGDMLMNMFVGIDSMGRGGSPTASKGTAAGAMLLPSMLGAPNLSKLMSAATSSGNAFNGFTGAVSPTTVIVNQSNASGGGLNLGSLLGGQGGLNLGKQTNIAGAAAKTKTFGPINYLTAAMLGYGIGSSTNNRAIGVLGGAAAGFLTAGPIGAVLGALGGLFGRKKNEDAPPPVQPAREFYALAKNSESLDANTRALNKISEGVWGAPSVFEFNKLQAENNAPRQLNLTVNVSGSMNKALATEVGNTILQTVSQGLSQSTPRTATVSTANWG